MDEHERALRAQLSALFAEELAERVDELRRVAGELEATPASAGARAALHRVLHVIKGASRSVGDEAIEGACHRLETALAHAGEHPVVLAPVYELADALDESRAGLRAGTSVGAQRFDRIAREGEDPDADAATTNAVHEADDTLRVPAAALDELVSASANVLQARQRLEPVIRALEQLRDEARAAGSASVRGLTRLCRTLSTSVDQVARSSDVVDDQIRRLRLRPFDEVIAGCARIAREAGASVGKQIGMTINAQGVHLDRVQVEALRDVMVQLVRNAAAHGIEDPETRRAAGKPERGQITVEAAARGDALTIEVRDDGAGLDRGWLARLAETRGRPGASDSELARLIFESGVSSATMITELAGRGVGLDVVKQRVERLHGSIDVQWTEHVGTTFIIGLPLTVARLRSLIVESAGHPYAVPITAIERLLWITPSEIRRGETRELMRVGDDWLVVASLGSVLGHAVTRPSRRVPGAVLAHAGRRVVVAMDRVIDAHEIAFEPLDPRLGKVRCVAGATTLPDGTVALILQTSEVADAAMGILGEMFSTPTPARAPRSVLLVDDSATTRALEANILRAAGYVVRTAVDGEDALRQLAAASSDIIVSDVDMPNLDGIALTVQVRSSADLAGVPVVLVSARGSDEDRARGMRAGANAYLVKSSFDQGVLLETLARLL